MCVRSNLRLIPDEAFARIWIEKFYENVILNETATCYQSTGCNVLDEAQRIEDF